MAADTTLLGDTNPCDLMDVETERLDRYFSSLGPDEWTQPTACAAWDRRALLGHLGASEEYNHACLDDRLGGFLKALGERGTTDLESFNAIGVADWAGLSTEEALARWRTDNGRTRDLLRQRAGGELATSVGPYPVDWQAWHLANELAIHADDAGVPVAPDEAAGRVAWLAQFAKFALTETGKDVAVEPAGDGYRVRSGGEEVELSAADLVAAVNGRALPSGAALSENLRAALSMT